MKKVNIFTAIAVLAILFASCSKSPDFAGTKPSSQEPPKPSQSEVNFVSDWSSANSYSVSTDRLGQSFITGVFPHTSVTNIKYDKGTHIELAYTRTPSGQRIPYLYKRLPFDFMVGADRTNSTVSLDFSIDPDAFKIYFQNADYITLSKAANQSISEDWKFRYIIIPKTKYQTMNVDWNDLRAVSSALNFSL